MDVYVFQAALWCADCTAQLKTGGLVKPAFVDETDESSYDSDDWPKGPYSDGGGEADSPQHCDCCGVFLENPLTGDGENYVRGQLLADLDRHSSIVSEWRNFYDYIELD